MRVCPRCQREKDDAEFNRRRTGFQPYCRTCQHEYHGGYYRNNTAIWLERNKANKAAKATIVREIKQAPCMDCGNKFHHCAMDFDHRDGATKKRDVARMVTDRVSVATLLAEIEKCDLVCANCHRVRTFNRSASAKQEKATRLSSE